MVAKPNTETILETYTLDELLDLAKQKVRIETNELIDLAKKHLDELSSSVGKPISTPVSISQPISRTEPYEPQKRARNKKPLNLMIQDVLGKAPMNVDDILSALVADGYTSNSLDPKRVLYLELKKLADKKKINKEGRGLYTM